MKTQHCWVSRSVGNSWTEGSINQGIKGPTFLSQSKWKKFRFELNLLQSLVNWSKEKLVHFRSARFSIFRRHKDLVLPRFIHSKFFTYLWSQAETHSSPSHAETLTSRSLFLINRVLFPFEQNADLLKSRPFEKLNGFSSIISCNQNYANCIQKWFQY